MTKKKYVLYFLILTFIIYILITNKEINNFFNKNFNKKDSIISLRYGEIMSLWSYEPPENRDYYFLVENYKGDYSDLKKIHNHILNIYKLHFGKDFHSIEFTDRDYRTSEENEIFVYGLDYDQLKQKKIMFSIINRPDSVEYGLSGLDFASAFNHEYVLNKEDISVADFTQWVNFIPRQIRESDEGPLEYIASDPIYDGIEVAYAPLHLYNKDKTQHITMICEGYNKCDYFKLIMQ